jgi:hypothetical protein
MEFEEDQDRGVTIMISMIGQGWFEDQPKYSRTADFPPALLNNPH